MTALLYRALLAFALTGTLLLAPATRRRRRLQEAGQGHEDPREDEHVDPADPVGAPDRAKKVAVCVKTAPSAKRCMRKVRTRKNGP